MVVDPVEVARTLGIPPCRSCGQLLGGRYGSERACWPCYVKDHPRALRQPQRPGKTPYLKLVDDVWDRMSKVARVFCLRKGELAGRCPICGAVLIVQILDTDPPRLRLHDRGDPLGPSCRGGCDAREVARELLRA